MNTERRLLAFNLAADADDPVLASSLRLMNALALHFDAVDVITMRAGRLATAPNVRVFSVGKERGYGEPRRAVEFFRILTRLLAAHHYDACFAHMIQAFAAMAAPLLRLRGVPVTLWYAHGAAPLSLRVAEKLVNHVVSSTAETFRLPTRKLIVVGQGIDTDLFVPPTEKTPSDRFRIVSVGRIGRVKRLEVLLEAIHLLRSRGLSLDVNFYGPEEPQYGARLRAQAREPGLDDVVRFMGPVVHEEVAKIFQAADVAVNLTPEGGFDRSALEAMACGLPVVLGNSAFDPLLGEHDALLQTGSCNDPAAYADRLHQVAGLSPKARRSVGFALRAAVVRDHSLERLARVLATVVLSREVARGADSGSSGVPMIGAGPYL